MNRISGMIAALLLLGFAGADASPAGLADSNRPFSITRSTGILAGKPNSPVILETGDRVQAGEDLVRIEGLTGQTVLVGENSSVQFQGSDALHLDHGGVALSAPAAREVEILVDHLQVRALPFGEGEPAPDNGHLVVGRLEEDKIEVFTQGRRFVVNELPEGNQLAVLGMRDSITFVRNDLGRWTPIVPLMQIEGDPTQRQEDEEDRDEGIAAFFRRSIGTRAAVGAAAGAAIIGIIYWTQRDDDDDDDDDNDFFQGQPSSPVTPTPVVQPPPTESDDDLL